MGREASLIKQRQVYKETYRLHAAKIKTSVEPVLYHCTAGTIVHSAYLLAAGKVERDGVLLEFQDLRVYLKVP